MFTHRRSSLARILRCLIFGTSVLLMLPGAWGNSATVVEVAQIPAGLAAWERHSLAIYRVCGPVSKWLYALPAYLTGFRVRYPASYDFDVVARHEWDLGIRFQEHYQQEYQALYRWSRLLPIVVTVLGGCLVCEWSTKLFGTRSGVVSLCVWCWMVPVLAQGSLVTSDMLSAVLALLSARLFWAFLLRPSVPTLVGAGLSLGLAQATKFTLLALDPCWAVLLTCRVFQVRAQAGSESVASAPGGGDVGGEGGVGPKQPNPAARRAGQRPGSLEREDAPPHPGRLLGLGLGVLIVSIATIDACYGFRDVGCGLELWRSGMSSLARDAERLAGSPLTGWLLRARLPLPAELLRGLDVQLADTERIQSAYLLGWSRRGGWWYWYAVAALIKVPLPALFLFVLSWLRVPRTSRGGDALLWGALCLLAPAVELFGTVSAMTGTGSNAAFRYMLPVLALLCVWAGHAWDNRLRVGPCLITALLGWLLVNAVVAIPDHLGWQNEVGWAWERRTGHPALIGDSLDWGQDQARLGAWIARHPGEGATVICLHGIGHGEPYGLGPPVARATSKGLDGAVFLAVSANVLFNDGPVVCLSVADGRSALVPRQCEALRLRGSYERVGRTVRIYRLRDLPRDLFPSTDRGLGY